MSGLHTLSTGTAAVTSKASKIAVDNNQSVTSSANVGSGGHHKSLASDSISSINSDGGNSTAADDAGASSDSAGNTIFFLCIVAILAVALGLGIWLWRKNKRNKAIRSGQEQDGKTSGLFGRKNRPSALPLTNIRNPEDSSLPPYSTNSNKSQYDFTGSPIRNGTGGTPLSARTDSMKRMQDEYNGVSSSEQNVPNTPFSPFAPFSPVNATAQTINGHTPAIRSSLYQTDTIQPSSIGQYLDPDAASAMGIHPSVINEADSGVSDAEIERRRAKAQKRLEKRQRDEEGSVVEDVRTQTSGFRQWARTNES